MAVITFHHGEDRRVKKARLTGLPDGAFVEIADDVIRPGDHECRSNSRATTAKLRWARRRIQRQTVRV